MARKSLSAEEDRELQIRRELAKRERSAANIAAIDELLESAHTRQEAEAVYAQVSGDIAAERKLCLEDLWFLLTVACGRKDMRDHPRADWLFARAREVQSDPDGHLDLWARDHYKSTIITFGLTLQDILNNPEVTIGIFSHTRSAAKDFLKQIKFEFETNEYLKARFPEILYGEPDKEATQWSLDGGIIVKRKTNPKEATIEACGLVEGMPTGKHYKVRVYDDTVTQDSTSTPEQIKKTTVAWEMSQNLGSGDDSIERYIGTRYHAHDTYKEMITREAVVARIHTATDTGKYPEGSPVLLSQAALDKKRTGMGPYTFNTQMLQNPTADKAMSFKEGWLKFYDKLGDTSKWNKYLLVDPASKKKKTSDYTVMLVIGLAPDGNYYLIDGIRDRLNLTQRAAKVFGFHREHEPNEVGYEEYGIQADVEHIESEMERENYRFAIKRLGGQIAKEDRIQRLIPPFEQGKIYLPRALFFFDHEGNRVDLIKKFLDDEYKAWPVAVHDDMLDCLARILDSALDAKFPKAKRPFGEGRHKSGRPLGWMGN